MKGAGKMDVEAEIRDLKRRVGELEGSFQFLTTQISGVHRDLLAFQESATGRFDQLHQELRSLRQDLPGIVGDAVRGVLRP